MDLKEEVRRRIAELTRFAYERGYRDGAQSTLTEIESIATDDVVEELGKLPAPLEVIATKEPPKEKLGQSKRPKAPKRKPKANEKKSKKPKTVVVQEALLSLLDTKGEARRDEVLIAAQKENSAITKFDLGNCLRILVKNEKVRVSQDDSGVILPANLT